MNTESYPMAENTASLREWRDFAEKRRESRPRLPDDVEIIWVGNSDWQPNV